MTIRRPTPLSGAARTGSAGLTCVLLDVDGTLVDSNQAHAEAWAMALAEHGLEVPATAIRRHIGKGGDRILLDVTGVEQNSELGEKITARHEEIFLAQCVPSLRAFSKAPALVRAFKKMKLTVGVASSSPARELTALLEIAGVAHLVDSVTNADNASLSKPAPDVLLRSCGALGVSPHFCMVLGGTPYDLEAARRAGMRALAVRSGGWPAHELAGAEAVYEDVAALLKHLEQSPLVQRRDAPEKPETDAPKSGAFQASLKFQSASSSPPSL